VDREERPDVDQLYMTAVQVLNASWRLADERFSAARSAAFYGGTYFPPKDHGNRPGFVTLLKGIEEAYKNRRADVDKSAVQITDILAKIADTTRTHAENGHRQRLCRPA